VNDVLAPYGFGDVPRRTESDRLAYAEDRIEELIAVVNALCAQVQANEPE